MARNVRYSYNYACGANAYVKINGVILLEAVQIQWNLAQNKIPLYGYNSAEFGAIADGQVFVQGQLIVNDISHEYLYAVLRKSATKSKELTEVLLNDSTIDAVTVTALTGDSAERDAILVEQYWGRASTVNTAQYNISEYNSDIFEGKNFGRPDQYNRTVTVDVYVNDKLRYKINNVSFTGRGQMISIDDQPLLESFPFIASSVL